jgi:hypothetical protein
MTYLRVFSKEILCAPADFEGTILELKLSCYYQTTGTFIPRKILAVKEIIKNMV